MTDSITFIGGGNMATAIIAGLAGKGAAGAHIEVVDPSDAAHNRLAGRFGVTLRRDLAHAHLGKTVILAVKPQQLKEAAAQLAPRMGGRLAVSMAAGVRVADLARWLGGHERIVRTMPNTPAMVGAGITALYAGPAVDAADRSRAEAILRAVGAAVWVAEESQLDAVTAVSGSGPAYVFYFMEALEAAAGKEGLAPEVARQLALQTFVGAARLALESGEEPATLRARVTSKGGTTERGIAALQNAGVPNAVAQAVAAARRRSEELGDELGAAS